jgi:hypothetical protein
MAVKCFWCGCNAWAPWLPPYTLHNKMFLPSCFVRCLLCWSHLSSLDADADLLAWSTRLVYYEHNRTYLHHFLDMGQVLWLSFDMPSFHLPMLLTTFTTDLGDKMSISSLSFPAYLVTIILGSKSNLLCGLLTYSSNFGLEPNSLQYLWFSSIFLTQCQDSVSN